MTRWVLAHKRLVAGLWLAVTVAAFASIGPAIDALSEEVTVPGREGFETNREIAEAYGSGGDVAPLVPVVTLPEGTTVDSPGVAGELDAALARVQAALPDARVASYASTGDRAFVSEDGRTTFALVFTPFTGGLEPGRAEARLAQRAVDGSTVGGAPVEVTGLDALRAESAGAGEGASVSVLVEVLVAAAGALVILAVVFASFMAVVPLLMALIAIPTTFLLVWPLAEVTDVSIAVEFLIALVGLGIAIDYALLVVMRWREEHRRGVGNEAAVANAMRHAGSAVVFSGTTVAIALLALVALPVPVLRSIGIAGLLIALVSVAVATTLLPVVLATVGPRLDWPRGRGEDRASRAWTAWAGVVVRRRWVAAAVSTAVLAVLSVAAFSIQLGNPRAESLAQSGTARAAFERLEGSGIGSGPLAPFDALVRAGDPDLVAEALAGVEGVRGAVAPEDWRRDGTALVAVLPTDDGNSPAGRATLDRIRERAQGLPAQVAVGGQAAQGSDFVDAVYGNFPLMLVLISGLTFVLLARAFRAVILPLQAVVLNLLSVAAAWGVMVLVWQNGLGSEAIWGIDATGSINVEMPIVVFAFLFGVSMDYQVFIISRMREAYDRTGSTKTAVVEGIGRTGRLVTSAALILGLAFVALSASPGTEIKMFATALAAGILIDATIVRGLLVPAVVSILGRWNWWLPHWPARVLKVEASPVRERA
ncbi:MAG TPA: MMPL family transporter [Gaiellaceae bacterium]|nr:MMPL family transporter [Gaiellaceae bacterium]